MVGQEPAPKKCVLMSTSKAIRGDMKDLKNGLLPWILEILEVILVLLSGLVQYACFGSSAGNPEVDTCCCAPS